MSGATPSEEKHGVGNIFLGKPLLKDYLLITQTAQKGVKTLNSTERETRRESAKWVEACAWMYFCHFMLVRALVNRKKSETDLERKTIQFKLFMFGPMSKGLPSQTRIIACVQHNIT